MIKELKSIVFCEGRVKKKKNFDYEEFQRVIIKKASTSNTSVSSQLSSIMLFKGESYSF